MRNVSDGVDLDNIYDYLSLEPKKNGRLIMQEFESNINHKKVTD